VAITSCSAGRWLPLALALLSGWALIEAVWVWGRAPAPPPPALPERMQLQGRWLARRKPSPLVAPLPDGVLLQAGADYGSGAGPAPLRLRWLALASSGGSVGLDPERLSVSVLGPKARGVCRMVDARSGALLGVAANGTEALALLRRNDPSGIERLQWALGLRPWRINRCLFVGVLPR
jgi:hypothetical protein